MRNARYQIIGKTLSILQAFTLAALLGSCMAPPQVQYVDIIPTEAPLEMNPQDNPAVFSVDSDGTEESFETHLQEEALADAGLPRDETGDVPQEASGAEDNHEISSDLLHEKGKPLANRKIGIDAGHQAKANRKQEPVAPGAETMKNKVSSGTQGRTTGIPEYEVNLDVALLLQELLAEAGAEVIMVRTSNDVDISNVERARFFNDAVVDLGIRLHCNGSEDTSAHGAFMLVPENKNYPYYEDCIRAAELILKSYGEETGISVKRGITYRSDQTGFNWCNRPICNIEMGHMTNKEDELKLVDRDFQVKMAQGIYKGIVSYFCEE